MTNLSTNKVKRFAFSDLNSVVEDGKIVKISGFDDKFPFVDIPKPDPTLEKKYNEKDIENARQQSYQKGFQDGEKEGTEKAKNEQIELDKRIEALLGVIVHQLSEADNKINSDNSEIQKKLVMLSAEIAKKIGGAALKNDPLPKIEKAIEECIKLLIPEKNITISVNASVKDIVEKKTKEFAAKLEYKGKILVKSDSDIKETDAKLEWDDGSMKLDNDSLVKEIDKIVNNIAEGGI